MGWSLSFESITRFYGELYNISGFMGWRGCKPRLQGGGVSNGMAGLEPPCRVVVSSNDGGVANPLQGGGVLMECGVLQPACRGWCLYGMAGLQTPAAGGWCVLQWMAGLQTPLQGGVL